MKIICTQENLNQGLLVVSHVASKSVNLPILNNILIQTEDSIIKLSSTNLEIGVNCVIRGKVEKPGSFTVQSKLIADYVNLLPKEKVELEVISKENNSGENYLKIICKNYTTKINGMSAADYPLIPQIVKKDPYICKAVNFKNAISQVIFAVSTNETRPEISGILIDFKQEKLVLAATDSYRLAEKSVKLNKKSSQKTNRVIVPTKTMQELSRILSSLKDPSIIEDIENVEIYVSENQILFTLGNVDLISRLIEGQYPDYKQIIPQNYSTNICINKSEIIKATKTASLFTRSGIFDVSLEFNSKNQEVLVSSTNNQLGENQSKLSAEIEGQDNNIVVNYRYLLDGLQNIDSNEVKLEITDNSSPCVLLPKTEDDYLYIIMPIKQ